MLSFEILLIFMIVAAIISIEMDDILSSIVAFGSVGLMLAICFLLLRAPDLAIVQLLVEIIALVILIRATVERGSVFYGRRDILTYTISLVAISAFLTISYFVLTYVPPFGEPLMTLAQQYIDTGMAKTGASNIVSSITLGFRAIDSIGEIIMLFATAIGIIAVMKTHKRRKSANDPRDSFPL